jgi:chemotaxis protein MotB
LTVEGHTDAQAFPGGERGYSNWELSADRANASRRELIVGGLPEARTLRVQGLAASKLLDSKMPESPVNRRISIIVMNRDAEDAVLKNFSEEEDSSEPSDADPAKIPSSSASQLR